MDGDSFLGDTFNVEATHAGATVVIDSSSGNAGSGTSTVNITPTAKGIGDLAGPLTVTNFGDSTTNLLIDDRSDSQSQTYNMTTSTFSCNTSALVSYTDMGKVTLEGGIGPANQLNVAGGSEGGETWSASTQIVGSAFGVVIQGTTGTNTLLGPPIYATRIADLSLDTMPVTMNGSALPSPGNNTFIVNDLSLTGIQNVTVNAHESQMLDAKHDTITVNSSQINADNVVVANNGVEQNQISNLEDVTLSPLSQTGPWPLIPYTVAAASPIRATS